MTAVRCCRYLWLLGMDRLQSRIDELFKKLEAEYDKVETNPNKIEFYTDLLGRLEAELKSKQDGSGSLVFFSKPTVRPKREWHLAISWCSQAFVFPNANVQQ